MCTSGASAELVQPARELLEAGVNALDRVLRQVLDPLREHVFRIACEALDGEVELAPEPLRSFLPSGAKRRVELLRSRFGVAGRLARDRASQLLDLPHLDVADLAGDPL